MTFSSPVDGFRLAYDRVGSGLPVVLLHGWPGDRTDYRDLVPLLAGSAQVIVPDLRGFGRSDKHLDEPEAAYSGAGQARSVTGLIDELGLEPAVNRLVVAMGGPSGRASEGVIALAVWAVPMEIVTWDGTNSGSLSAWARLKKICFFAR